MGPASEMGRKMVVDLRKLSDFEFCADLDHRIEQVKAASKACGRDFQADSANLPLPAAR
jgi:hypothetical protein